MPKKKKYEYKIGHSIIGMEYAPKLKDLATIRSILSLPINVEWPRCRSKNWKAVHALREQGDQSHVPNDHICNKCRCTNVAGIGTKDDLYGIPGVGHFGTGMCAYHERCATKKGRFSKGSVVAMAKKHIAALQTMGKADVDEQIYMEKLGESSKVASEYQEIRRGIGMMHDYIAQFYNRFNSNKAESEIVTQLKALTEAVKAVEFVDPSQGTDIIDKLDQLLFWEGTLTESGRGGPVRMSDATKATTLSTLVKSMATLESYQFKMSEKDYIVYDEVLMRLNRVFDLARRMFHRLHEGVIRNDENILDDVKKQFLKEFMDIWSNVRRGKK